MQIEKVMQEKHISQADIARHLGVQPQSIYAVLKGKRANLPKSLTAILEVLDLELVVQKKTHNNLDARGVLNLSKEERATLLKAQAADMQAFYTSGHEYMQWTDDFADADIVDAVDYAKDA